MGFVRKLLLVFGAALALGGGLSACMDRELAQLNPCLVSGVSETKNVKGVEKVDLLFAVDNSSSMLDEQDKLAEELPKLITTLVSGKRRDGTVFSPAKDLHLGVISTDMGVPGMDLPRYMCTGYGGDGRLINAPSDSDCVNPQLGAARFISYNAGQSGKSPEEVGAEFGCLARTGAGGCGYEMQLESILKALFPHPAFDLNPMTNSPYDAPRVTFLTADGAQDNPEAYGHGGPAPSAGSAALPYNAGFLRSDPVTGQSLLAVVLVTDEEDCSARNTGFLQPGPNFTPGFEYLSEMPVLNLRCYNHGQRTDAQGQPFLWPTERYVKFLKELRPGNEQLVIFAAIAGVPPQLVSQEALAAVDFGDEPAREAFYRGILAHPDMQEVVEGGNLRPACVADDAVAASQAGAVGRSVGASPARRIVDVVRGFGENGVIQSICQQSFEPAINAIIDVIARRLGDLCLPRRLVRDADGRVPCKVFWEMPAGGDGSAAVASCEDLLPDLGAGLLTGSRLSGAQESPSRCELPQLVATGDQAPPASEVGWYYDDFSTATMESCTETEKQRIAFTPDALPPPGVKVDIECLSETQVPQPRPEVDHGFYQAQGRPAPTIGSACPSGDSDCQLRLLSGAQGGTLFCHDRFLVCEQRCQQDTDCPPAFVCDTRSEQAELAGGVSSPQPYCVNPTCGTY